MSVIKKIKKMNKSIIMGNNNYCRSRARSIVIRPEQQSVPLARAIPVVFATRTTVPVP